MAGRFRGQHRSSAHRPTTPPPHELTNPFPSLPSLLWQAIVRRLPPISPAEAEALKDQSASPGGAIEVEDGPIGSGTAGFPAGTETLLNLTDTSREGGALRRMAAVLTKLESLSNILVWSVSDARPGEECAISSIELPRLRNAFTVTKDDDGVVRMYSQSDAGKFIADYVPPSIGRHAAGIPHAVVLADRLDQYYLLVPAATVQRPRVQICPFSCQLVVERPSVCERSSATYLYSVHPSGLFVESPDLSASLYLTALCLMKRDYEAASNRIASCFTDTRFTPAERWAIDLAAQTADDTHPDAQACRLRLARVCVACGEDSPFDMKKDYQGYLNKYVGIGNHRHTRGHSWHAWTLNARTLNSNHPLPDSAPKARPTAPSYPFTTLPP